MEYFILNLVNLWLGEQNPGNKAAERTILIASHQINNVGYEQKIGKIFTKNLLDVSPGHLIQNIPKHQRVSVIKSSSEQKINSYYISPLGNDLNLGTSPASAWRTINKVNNSNFRPGDRILFQGGAIFKGNLMFDANDSGTAINPIIISSYGRGRATINAEKETGINIHNTAGYYISNLNVFGSGSSTNRGDGINFYNDLAGNVKLEKIALNNVEVSGFGNYGIAIGGWNQQSGYRNVRVTNVLTHDNRKAGLITYAQMLNVNQNIYVAYVRAYNNLGIPQDSIPTGSGIVLGSVNTGVIEHSVAHNNGALNNSPNGPVGIWTYDSTNITIQYNESYKNRTGGTADGDGFDLDQNVSNSVVQYNFSHDNDGAGFLLSQGADNLNHTGNTIRYNISQNDARKLNYGGIHIFGQVRNAEIYNNTVFMEAGSIGSPSTVLIYNPVNSVHFRNNIFQTKNGLKLIVAPQNSTDLLFQGNNYYATGSSFNIRWGEMNYNSLNSWRIITGQEKLLSRNVGMSLNPLFINPNAGKTINNPALLNKLNAYRLNPTSPLIDAGLNLKLLFGINPGTQDFYGKVLPNRLGYDIGANEF
ncbi:MAG: right-handed parallel beta-helix repeat-containing protein [Aulosira sp. DedQUE10]|nr:right-handed parallel beta-helix repeat-containing protein [Aulosira sp. DedQUE10]